MPGTFVKLPVEPMHLMVLVRGLPEEMRKWEGDWAAQYFPYKFDAVKLPFTGEQLELMKTQLGLNKQHWLQMIVRPVQLYEMAFPATAKDEVFKTLFNTNAYVKQNYLLKGLPATAIRMALGLKPVPEFNENSQHRIIRDGVSVHPIGIKEDAQAEWGEYI